MAGVFSKIFPTVLAYATDMSVAITSGIVGMNIGSVTASTIRESRYLRVAGDYRNNEANLASVSFSSLRRSLQFNNGTSTTIVATDDPCLAALPDTSLFSLRVGAVFIILIASLLGVLMLLQDKHFKLVAVPAYLITFGKTVGSGILLACALVHLLQPASQSLTSVCMPTAFNDTYQAYAFLYCLLAFLFMQFLHNYLMWRFPKAPSHTTRRVTNEGNPMEPNLVVNSVQQSVSRVAITPVGDKVTDSECSFISDPNDDLQPPIISVQEALAAEFAFNCHSVIIGLTTGLSSNAALSSLLIALSFHQFFEGIALGARLFQADFGTKVDMVFTLLFACSAPIGITVGVSLLHSTINLSGFSFLMAQGTLDAVTSGMLLHIAASKLIIDFPKDCTYVQKDGTKLFGLYLAVSLGAGFMAYIGVFL